MAIHSEIMDIYQLKVKNNAMIKKNKYLLLVSLLIILVFLIAYKLQPNSNEQNVIVSFLKEFYEMTDTDEEITMDEMIQVYNEKFDSYVTEECLITLWKNRHIMEYLSFLKKNNCTIGVDKVNLKETKQTEDMVQFKYELYLKIRKGKTEQVGIGSGIIKIEKHKENRWEISYFQRTDIK